MRFTRLIWTDDKYCGISQPKTVLLQRNIELKPGRIHLAGRPPGSDTPLRTYSLTRYIVKHHVETILLFKYQH
jgi:hypothetical protein